MHTNGDKLHISSDDFVPISHPNGTTAWEAGTYAAKAAERGLGEVQQGWDGITPEETGRIMRATVRRLLKAYKGGLDRQTFISHAELDKAEKMLEAVQDDDFANAAALAIVVANPGLFGLSR